ncbi:MAG: hypothetical protein QG662_1264 [Pseudomonadota bacterium]|nr:hypothetical protein [Pseudomonadota bacterium]
MSKRSWLAVCAMVFGGLLGQAQAQTLSLSTTYAGGNGQDGNMFDVVALNDIRVTGFDVNCGSALTQDFEIYGKTGSYVGSELVPGDWTLIASVPGVVCNAPGVATPLGAVLDVAIASGQTYAFYVTENGLVDGVDYTNGTAVGQVAAANTDLQILEGAGVQYPFAGTFQPRIWNGTLYYVLDAPVAPIVTPVPTLSEYGLGLLAVLLVFAARRSMRGRFNA